MAGASEKARFYLERSVPELRQLEESKIFNKDEITSIAKKRSEFEHKLGARGSKSSDYTRYLEYETNLESLRQKRAKRLGSKGRENHVAQRRILSIMQRATRKFHGDLGLWLQYFELTRRYKMHKKSAEILTSMVRLYPTKPEVWTFAAKYAFEEHGDMVDARSYMQRGLRFCKSSYQLWLDYGKLELIYIAKIAARQKILGLDQVKMEPEPVDDDPGADMVKLPTITAEELDLNLQPTDKTQEDVIEALSRTPTLSGAIPKAIFDVAMKEFGDITLGGKFFDMVAQFSGIPCAQSILNHIVDHLSTVFPQNAVTLDASIRLPIIGIDINSGAFPKVLGPLLMRFKTCLKENPSPELIRRSVDWIVSFLEMDLDEDIRAVLGAILSHTLTCYVEVLGQRNNVSAQDALTLLKRIKSANILKLDASFGQWAVNTWPSDLALQSATHGSSAELLSQ